MLFHLSIKNTVLRFYLMMLVGIAAVYAESAVLILLTFAVAVGAILGVSIRGPKSEAAVGKRVHLEPGSRDRRKAG